MNEGHDFRVTLRGSLCLEGQGQRFCLEKNSIVQASALQCERFCQDVFVGIVADAGEWTVDLGHHF